MPANVPSVIVHGTDIDLVVGPAGDLPKCYFDGAINIKASHAKKVKMTNYLAHNDAMSLATPEYMITAPVIIKRENGVIANAHPGMGLSRSVIACASDRGAHGFPMGLNDAGYFVLGDIDSGVEVGLHRKLKVEAELLFFSVTAPSAGGL